MEIKRIEDTSFFDVKNEGKKSFAIKIGDLIQLVMEGSPINFVGIFEGFKNNLIQVNVPVKESHEFINVEKCTFCIRLVGEEKIIEMFKSPEVKELEDEIERLELKSQSFETINLLSEERIKQLEVESEELNKKIPKLEKAVIAQGIVIAEKS